ncbi:MAG: FIST C-terminal domain-containing protein [Rubrivivax sp.]|nr:FIST C-terminal domain-containing protein [Rubrivivax sp.]
MSAFLVGHATHPDWRGALALAAAQIEARRAEHEASARGPLSLGFVYFTDHFAGDADALVAELRRRWPGVAWVGSVGVGVAAMGVEYFDEPALVLMLAALPTGRFEVFSGARKLQRVQPFSALVHADPATPDLAELIGEMSDRVSSGYLFGGLASSRSGAVHVADGAWRGGLSGVAFTRDVALVSRVTQGSQPLGPVRRITSAERNLVLALDGEPALPCLLRDLGLADLSTPRTALNKLRATLVALADADAVMLGRPGQFGPDTRVRHLVGLDPARNAVAVADTVEPGMSLVFCQRDMQAARRDLVRICAEIRDEVESAQEPAWADGAAHTPDAGGAEPARRIAGAIYVSCAGRGGPHFGGPSAELQIVQHALSGGGPEVPLVGFFAGGEIARHHVYGYTGVLTVFTGHG